MNEVQRKRLIPIFIVSIFLIAGAGVMFLKSNFTLIYKNVANISPSIMWTIFFILVLIECVCLITSRFNMIKWTVTSGIIGFILSLPTWAFYNISFTAIITLYMGVIGVCLWIGKELWMQQKQIDYKNKIRIYEKANGKGSYFKAGGPGYMPPDNWYYKYNNTSNKNELE